MRSVSLAFMILVISGCKEKQVNKSVSQNEQQPKTGSVKQLSIEKIGELRFRKSYAGHNEMTDKEYLKLFKAKPRSYHVSKTDSLLLKRFRGLGYLNNKYELLTEKLTAFKLFNYEKPDTTFRLTDALNNKISCLIKKADSVYKYELFVADNSQGLLFKIDHIFILPGLQFTTFDAIAGGFEEIVLLDAYYIINGDNFDFFIYGIKYN